MILAILPVESERDGHDISYCVQICGNKALICYLKMRCFDAMQEEMVSLWSGTASRGWPCAWACSPVRKERSIIWAIMFRSVEMEPCFVQIFGNKVIFLLFFSALCRRQWSLRRLGTASRTRQCAPSSSLLLLSLELSDTHVYEHQISVQFCQITIWCH